jgi:choline dehydrogenase-like flavoprotein
MGGCSSINGTVYVRGAVGDFDRWSALCGHVGGWAARDIMPLFSEMESSDQPSTMRGHGGPLYVRTVRRPHPITSAFIESASVAGYPFNDDYNGTSQEGVSFIQLSQRRGMRCSAADAFLRPSLRAANIKLLLHTSVERIEVRNGRAMAVSFLKGGAVYHETAHDIILCAGAINSPKLLMQSGIGDAKELERHSIAVALDLPGVGCNLTDHPLVRMTFHTNMPTHNPTEGVLQKLRIAAEYLLNQEGPIANLFESMGFVRSDPAKMSPDLQLFFLTVGYAKAPDGRWQLASQPAVMLYVAHSYPLARGRVRLASGNPHDAPLIELCLLDEASDLDTLIRGIQIGRDIMSRPPIAQRLKEEVTPGPCIASPAALAEFIRSNANICYHSTGTCRMGTDPGAVTDPYLRVRGTENLWIADASIMPDPISANINAACMMIGKKLGRQLIARG